MASQSTSSRRALFIAVGVLLAAAVGAVVWFLGDDAPSSVDIDAAADAVADDVPAADATTADGAAEDEAQPDELASDDASGGDTTAGAAAPDDGSEQAGADGVWVVDTSIGEFSVLETTGTFVGFRLAEELANIGATEAVGRTPDVSGDLTVADGVLIAATFTAELTSIESDRPRRDDRIQSALETGSFPTATFELTDPVPVDGLAEGTVIEVVAGGTLTVRGVEQAVEVPLQATLRDGVAIVTGSFEITFAGFGVTVPTAPIVLSVADVGDVEFQLYLTRA